MAVLSNEAHLPAFRPLIRVRRIPRPKKSLTGWMIFAGLIALNEMRGLYMVAEFLKAWNG